jgi:hypothetical protein
MAFHGYRCWKPAMIRNGIHCFAVELENMISIDHCALNQYFQKWHHGSLDKSENSSHHGRVRNS